MPMPQLTIFPDEGEAQLEALPFVAVSVPWPQAVQQLRRDRGDGGVDMDRGQHTVPLAQEPVEHQQAKWWTGWIGIDHDVSQSTKVLCGLIQRQCNVKWPEHLKTW